MAQIFGPREKAQPQLSLGLRPGNAPGDRRGAAAQAKGNLVRKSTQSLRNLIIADIPGR